MNNGIHLFNIMVNQEWEDILDKCKEGGLNVIQTYAFWNVHEPIKGKVK